MSELALRLIEENKKTRATFLDLGNCGLTKVPEEIGELFWLEELSFTQVRGIWHNKLWISSEIKNLGSANNIEIIPAFWLVPKLRLGNPYLASSCLAVLREAGASRNPFPSGSLGTSILTAF